MSIAFWFDQPRNLLVYDSPTPDKLVQAVPGAVRMHNGYVAVPKTLYAMQLLRYFSHPVTEPMVDYDWPGRFKPFEAQRVTANFLALNPRSFVLSDMGTGKTLAALWAADFIMSQYPRGSCRALIVAPLSTLQRVWADAIFQSLLGRRTFAILHGDAAQRERLLSEPHDFYIINFDGLGVGFPSSHKVEPRGFALRLIERSDIRLAIVDEASAYRDGTTKRHRVARRILAPRDYLWLMTGTPTPNGPLDAHGMAKLVNNAYGESLTSYKNRIMYKVAMWKWLPRAGAQAEARRLLQPAVRFSIDDCVDLPPCTTQMRDVELSHDQKKAYDTLKRELTIAVKDGQIITAANEAVLRLKLIQISCGAIYGENHEVHHIDAAPRLAALHEVLEQTSEKVIIFAPLTSVLNMLNRELKNYTREIINGSVNMGLRNKIFSEFQETDNPRLLIADPATMSHGLTLVRAATIVWYGPTDRTELYLQANARINRPGQVNKTTIVQLAATPVEREIFHRLENNESMQGALLRMVKDGDK